MTNIGIIDENHEWCLLELMADKHNKEILAHFPDIKPEFLGSMTNSDLLRPMTEEMARLRIMVMPIRDFEVYLYGCAMFFVDKDALGTAFAVVVIGLLQPIETFAEKYYKMAYEWKEEILQKKSPEHTKQMELFGTCLRKLLNINSNKPTFDYLDQMLDDKYFHYLCAKNVMEEREGVKEFESEKDHVKRIDIRLTWITKRWKTQFFPNGVTPYLYKILEICPHYLKMRRYKQVRHLLAVVAELMKTINQDTEMFRKLRDYWFMVKTMHWGMIIAISELKEVLMKSPQLKKNLFLTVVEDLVIDFGIPLPDGEDPELPVDLVATDKNREPLYKKLRTYEKHLKRTKLPHISRLFASILICDINFYDANTSTPFCCGKHSCRHPHS